MCGARLQDGGDGRGNGRDPGAIHLEGGAGREDGGIQGDEASESHG